MADVFVSINRGVEGTKNSDFTTGSSSTSGDVMEFRWTLAAGLTRLDLIKGLKAIQRWVENAQNDDDPII